MICPAPLNNDIYRSVLSVVDTIITFIYLLVLRLSHIVVSSIIAHLSIRSISSTIKHKSEENAFKYVYERYFVV